MKYAKHISSFLLLAASLLILAACGQKSNCSGISFGGGSGGSSGGGLSGPGSVCGAGSGNGGGSGNGASTDLLYYLGGGTVIDAAGVTGTTFANLAGYTPTAFPNGTQLGLNFWIENKKFLYVPATEASGGGEVLGYVINRATGALTPIGAGSFATSTINADEAVGDPQGRFLYVADSAHGTIAVFKVDSATGALTASGSPMQTNAGPTHMTVDGTGTYLYFASGGDVFGFNIDQTSGTLTPLTNSPYNVQMRTVYADPAGKFLLGIPLLGDANVYVIPIGLGTGILGVPTAFPTVQAPADLALSPTGKFLFTFSVDSSNRPLPIEGFTFDDTAGTVTEMTSSPFVNLPKVNTGIFDQNGGTLLGVTTTSFFVYSVDSTTGTPTSPIPSLGVAHDERYAFTN